MTPDQDKVSLATAASQVLCAPVFIPVYKPRCGCPCVCAGANQEEEDEEE
jgi:hypothetical protein